MEFAHYRNNAFQFNHTRSRECNPWCKSCLAKVSVLRDQANSSCLTKFEKIFALSMGTEWRVEGLRAAANLTGLEIELPPQSPSAAGLIEAFEHARPDDGPTPSRRFRNSFGFFESMLTVDVDGAALAWMAHLDLLKHIVQSRLSTALIMEDDNDWDVSLRDKVMLPLAHGVREYTNAAADDLITPYGSHWDVLWMGHCGEWSQDWMPYHAWPDATVIPHSHYVGWARVDMEARLPEGVRTTHPTTQTVCTFSYGVTSHGALKILDQVGAGAGEAFDTALSVACRAQKLDCITIHPEIFHQYNLPATDGETSEIAAVDAHRTKETAAKTHMGSTANIRNSARCKALFNTTCQELP